MEISGQQTFHIGAVPYLLLWVTEPYGIHYLRIRSRIQHFQQVLNPDPKVTNVMV
jgi:hypothetical protein